MKNFPFVLLPGTLCDERVFRELVPHFKSYEVVDLRHSETTEEMLAKVEHISFKKFILIGFSMGGHIALEFALKYPERIEKLVILATDGGAYPKEEKELVLRSLPMIKTGVFKGITDRRLRSYLDPETYENLELRSLIHSMAGEDAKEVYLRQTMATLERKNLNQELPNLKVPTIFIGGVSDKIISIESIERSASFVPDAKFVALEKCGHFVTLERPAELLLELHHFI